MKCSLIAAALLALLLPSSGAAGLITTVTYVGSDFPNLKTPSGDVVSPHDIRVFGLVLDLMCYDLVHPLANTWDVEIFDGDNLSASASVLGIAARGFGVADFPAIFVLEKLMEAEPANLVDLQIAMWYAGGAGPPQLPLLNATQLALYNSAHTAGLALTTAQLHAFKVYSPVCLTTTGQACVDSQALVGSVPEPATLGLIGIGLLAIGLRRKRILWQKRLT